jgi:hypothetical protein
VQHAQRIFPTQVLTIEEVWASKLRHGALIASAILRAFILGWTGASKFILSGLDACFTSFGLKLSALAPTHDGVGIHSGERGSISGQLERSSGPVSPTGLFLRADSRNPIGARDYQHDAFLQHLAEVDRHIVEGLEQIGKLHLSIANREAAGQDAMESRCLLKTLLATQNLHEQHREMIFDELSQSTSAIVLRLRRTNLARAYQDWVHYTVIEDGNVVGRIYEDRAESPEHRWLWAVTGNLDPVHGTTCGKTATLEEAKAAFRTSWRRVSEVRRIY